MKIITSVLLGLGSIFSFIHQASACIGYSTVYETATFGNITVQRDTPIGSVIAKASSPITYMKTWGDCKTQGTVYLKMMYGTPTKSSISDVYLTNIPGIGIRSMLYGSYAYFNSPSTAKSQGNSASFSDSSGTTVELVMIGPVSSGQLESGPVGEVSFDQNPSWPAYQISISGGTINAVDCNIANKNINVTLDDILAVDLKAINSTAKPKNFDPGLDCKAGAKINVKLTGVKNTDTSALGVLQLTNAGSAGVAQGVGIQVLYNNVPLELNKNMLLKTSAGGLETFPFTVQYYQTKDTVTTGSANATATLEMTYQ